MKRIIDKVNDITEKTLADYDKNIQDVINYLKSIDVPKKAKVSEEVTIENVPEIIDIHEEKVYTDNVKKMEQYFWYVSWK